VAARDDHGDQRRVTTTGSHISASKVVFVPSADQCPPPRADTAIVILDTAWTPGPDDRADVLSIRPYLNRVIERHDLFEEALEKLDAWGIAAQLPDRLIVDGVTYWFRMRETMWHWLHERLLWRYGIEELLATNGPLTIRVPSDEAALIDVLGLLGQALIVNSRDAPDGQPASVDRTESRAVARGFGDRLMDRFHLRADPAASRTKEVRRREHVLAERVAMAATRSGSRVIVLTTPVTHARIGWGAVSDRRDPYFGAAIPELRKAGIEPIVIALGLSHGSDEDWTVLEADNRLLPQALLRTRWSSPNDEVPIATALETSNAAIDRARAVPLDMAGVDVAPILAEALRSALSRVIATDVRQTARIGRLIAELKPDAILLAQEWIRIPWLAAAASSGVPVFAAQHGVLYRTHPGYPAVRHPALVFPSCTFVYGDFSRRVLLDGAYEPSEVEVSGSPRLDLDAADNATEGSAAPGAARGAVRSELGVAVSDQMLVVSTLPAGFVRRSHLVHMIERLLGGPLPGVHLVFKQHPGELDDGPYRALIEGLAQAGGYAPPPMSVVRDIDLYRLLRAADAHLGLHSTVLTEAVAAGTQNLIAIVEGHADLIGYVAAGVARPVSSIAEVRAALADPTPPDPAARNAFLDDQFRPGDASQRMVDAIRTRLG
jgi:hypothetical protein